MSRGPWMLRFMLSQVLQLLDGSPMFEILKKLKQKTRGQILLCILLFCIVTSFPVCLRIPYISLLLNPGLRNIWPDRDSGRRSPRIAPRIFGMDADMERVELNLKSWFLVKGETHKITMYDNIYIYIISHYIQIYIYILYTHYRVAYGCGIVSQLVERNI